MNQSQFDNQRLILHKENLDFVNRLTKRLVILPEIEDNIRYKLGYPLFGSKVVSIGCLFFFFILPLSFVLIVSLIQVFSFIGTANAINDYVFYLVLSIIFIPPLVYLGSIRLFKMISFSENKVKNVLFNLLNYGVLGVGTITSISYPKSGYQKIEYRFTYKGKGRKSYFATQKITFGREAVGRTIYILVTDESDILL
jgi:hypothetical protein